jgi:hypothetical protein
VAQDTHGANITLGNTYDNFHTYEVDWKPDSITWSIDGQVGRVLKKSDTFNATTKNYDFPQTPSRVQLSLWPGGLQTNDKGTIDWAGGVIDWNSDEVKRAGYYYVTFKEVKIECYAPPSGARKEGSGSKSYIYDNPAGLEGNVVMTDRNTILKSFLGTGTNMDLEPSKVSTKEGSTATNSPGASSTDVETIPGLSGAGTGANGQRGQGTGSDGSGSGGSGSGDGGSSNSGGSGFSQGNSGSTNPNPNEAPRQRVLKGSMLAVIVAVAAGMFL